MQHQFGSASLVAYAYEQELRADAARVRRGRVGKTGGDSGLARLVRYRRGVGSGLVRLGQWLQGTGRISPVDPALGPPVGPGPAH